MRPNTSQPKQRTHKSNAKSTTTLHELKRTVENFPSLRTEMPHSRMSVKELRSKGKLQLGSMIKPTMVLTKQERLNPWAKRTTISEEVLNKKGLLDLLHMGVIAKHHDCLSLLNNKYELPPKKDPQRAQPNEKETFMTNPAIMEAYYQLSRQKQLQEESKEGEEMKEKTVMVAEQKAIKRRGSTKKKVVKQQEPFNFDFITEEVVKLTILNFHVEKNDIYMNYVKKLRQTGEEHLFQLFISRAQAFTLKYNFKKVTIVPTLNDTRRLTEKTILQCIQNHKLFRMDLKVKGPSIEIFRWLLLSKLAKLRFASLQMAIKRIERIKNQFKIKKFYKQMVDKRWKFLNFKLGSFAENQRRMVADNAGKCFRAEVEIHVLAGNCRGQELSTYYKWHERKKAQLTRLYNNEADHVILLLNRNDGLDPLLESIQALPSSWKKPHLHVFYSSLSSASLMEEYADLYFGLKPEHIRSIKRICDGRASAVIPYFISPYLPRLCETLGVNLFAGTFTQQSKTTLFEDDEQEGESEGNKDNHQIKFRRLNSNSRDLNSLYQQRFSKIILSNEVYQSKIRIRQLFQSLRLPTPPGITLEDANQGDFFEQLVRLILKMKSCNRWILKLPYSCFSRGLALLQTESLKIIKQARKRPTVREDDVRQIAGIIQAILVQKIALPHSSLMSGEEFVSAFKQQQGVVQCMLEGGIPLVIFGRIETNGVFSILGTCRKYYAENICFGAQYPAEQVNEEMLGGVRNACGKLYQLGVFGYVSFQLLLIERTKEFFFIDLVPHLDPFSSFYFYYRRLLDINQLDAAVFTNRLSRTLFYCPFIDNNGNKFPSSADLESALTDRKCLFDEAALQGFKFLYLNQEAPTELSLICFGADEGAAIRLCLEGLRFLVESGGEFNKFDKRHKSGQSDGLYIMDIIWKMRQIRKEVGDK